MATSGDLPQAPAPPRPKYLGTAPPHYPSVVPEPEGRWKLRHLLAVGVLSFLLGVFTGNVSAGPRPAAEAPDEVEALIDEVVGEPTSSSVSLEVARFGGTGSGSTPAFTVQRGWELRWESQSDLAITVYPASGGSPAPAVQARARSGSSPYPQPGTFHLGVNGTGNWTITVVESPASR